MEIYYPKKIPSIESMKKKYLNWLLRDEDLTFVNQDFLAFLNDFGNLQVTTTYLQTLALECEGSFDVTFDLTKYDTVITGYDVDSYKKWNGDYQVDVKEETRTVKNQMSSSGTHFYKQTCKITSNYGELQASAFSERSFIDEELFDTQCTIPHLPALEEIEISRALLKKFEEDVYFDESKIKDERSTGGWTASNIKKVGSDFWADKSSLVVYVYPVYDISFTWQGQTHSTRLHFDGMVYGLYANSSNAKFIVYDKEASEKLREEKIQEVESIQQKLNKSKRSNIIHLLMSIPISILVVIRCISFMFYDGYPLTLDCLHSTMSLAVIPIIFMIGYSNVQIIRDLISYNEALSSCSYYLKNVKNKTADELVKYDITPHDFVGEGSAFFWCSVFFGGIFYILTFVIGM